MHGVSYGNILGVSKKEKKCQILPKDTKSSRRLYFDDGNIFLRLINSPLIVFLGNLRAYTSLNALYGILVGSTATLIRCVPSTNNVAYIPFLTFRAPAETMVRVTVVYTTLLN